MHKARTITERQSLKLNLSGSFKERHATRLCKPTGTTPSVMHWFNTQNAVVVPTVHAPKVQWLSVLFTRPPQNHKRCLH